MKFKIRKSNNIWLLNASMWVVTGSFSAVDGNITSAIASVFAVFMCLMYRDAKNKLDKPL